MLAFVYLPTPSLLPKISTALASVRGLSASSNEGKTVSLIKRIFRAMRGVDLLLRPQIMGFYYTKNPEISSHVKSE